MNQPRSEMRFVVSGFGAPRVEVVMSGLAARDARTDRRGIVVMRDTSLRMRPNGGQERGSPLDRLAGGHGAAPRRPYRDARPTAQEDRRSYGSPTAQSNGRHCGEDGSIAALAR